MRRGSSTAAILGVVAATIGVTGCSAAGNAHLTVGSHARSSAAHAKFPSRHFRDSTSIPSRPTTAATTLARCHRSALSLAFEPSVQFQATGDRGDAFRIVNRSSTTCRLGGYPKVTLTDDSGKIIPFRYTNGQSQYVTRRPPTAVRLTPGGSAYVGVAKYRCDAAGGRLATSLVLQLPGQKSPLVIKLRAYAQQFIYCLGGPHSPGNTLSISPIEHSPRAVLG